VVHHDNARIHSPSMVAATVTGLGATCLFNARYSPDLAPIEMLFRHIKRELRKMEAAVNKLQVVRRLQQIVRDLN
jgi:transposase